jgi:hypothetical protein
MNDKRALEKRRVTDICRPGAGTAFCFNKIDEYDGWAAQPSP